MTARTLRILLIVGCLTPAVRAAFAAEPRSLTSLVGDDVGLCIELNHLSQHARRFARSEFVSRVKRLPEFRRILESKDFKRLQMARTRLEELAGKPLDRLVDGLLGDSVVLAVYPGGKGEPAGVLITRAKDDATITEALSLWERAEPGSATETRSFLKTPYHLRKRAARKGRPERALFYARLQTVFVLSDREEMIRKVIRLSQAGSDDSSSTASLATSKTYLAARKSLRGAPVLTAYLNPRKWDAALKIPQQPTAPLPLPLAFFKSCRWVMGSLRLDDGIVFDAVVEYDLQALPKLVRDAIARTDGSPGTLDRIPQTALIALAGRFDPAALRSLIHRLEAGNGGKKLRDVRATAAALLLGFDPVDDLLPGLGNGIVFYATAKKSGPLPFDALLAVELGNSEKNKDPKWRQRAETGLANVLRFFANLHNLNAAKAAEQGGGPLATVKSRSLASGRLHWIDSVAGFQPGFGITPAYLMFAGSPELIRDFTAPPKSGRLVAEPTFQSARKRFFPDANQVLFVNARLLRDHLRIHRQAMLALQAKSGPQSADRAAKDFDTTLHLLGLVDGGFVAVRIGKAQIRFTLGAVTAK